MLKVEKVSKSYGTLKAVDNLSFEIEDGCIFGLLGVNGAGKTTTFRMIVGLLEPDEGKITFNGKKIDYNTSEKIGFLTEERSLLVKMTVIDQVLYYGRLKGLDKKTILKRLDYWLEKLSIKEHKNIVIKNLSKGNQQKVQFITAVINEPKLLILDEPFTGLDPFNVSVLMEALKEMTKKGTIVIFSSHRMEHVEMFCEKLLILVKGKDILQGSLKEIKESFLEKVIHVVGDVDIEKIKKIEGVNKVKETHDDLLIYIDEIKYANDVFAEISRGKEIKKFVIEDPSLDEIFISKVGDILE